MIAKPTDSAASQGERPLAAPTRPLILHLAVDYNTPMREKTTNAIERFVDELIDVDNVVVAMRRTSNPFSTYFADCGVVDGRRLFACGFFGLPLGIGLYLSMRVVAGKVLRILSNVSLKPSLVHAHKLTFEGIVGWHVAKRLNIPLFISVRGEVESKVLRFKPTYRQLFTRILSRTSKLYYVSAWFREPLHSHFRIDPQKERLLPNIVRNIGPQIEGQPANGRFVTICNLDVFRRKGLHWLIAAFAQARVSNPGLKLDVVGDGTPESLAAVQHLIDASGAAQGIRVVGAVPHETLLAQLPSYLALLLPSVNETFGMVYVEALFAGIPVLFTRATGIDGYLDGLDVGVAVPAKDVEAIARGIQDLMARNAQYRERVCNSAQILFERFDKARYINNYMRDVRAALQATRPV